MCFRRNLLKNLCSVCLSWTSIYRKQNQSHIQLTVIPLIFGNKNLKSISLGFFILSYNPVVISFWRLFFFACSIETCFNPAMKYSDLHWIFCIFSLSLWRRLYLQHRPARPLLGLWETEFSLQLNFRLRKQ